MAYHLLPSSGRNSIVDFRKVKELRWEGKTFQEIADVWGVSRQFIDQICKKYGFCKAPLPPTVVHPHEKEFKRIIENHIKNQETGCWEWTRALSKEGYSRMTWKGTREYGHRVSYRVFKGTIPKELCVCHTCDNPRCINPDHLWLGTHQENMNDRDKKGRGFLKKYSK